MTFDRDRYQSKLLNLTGNRELLDSPLYVFDLIASTNQKLWELIDSGIQPMIAAIALEQSAGKGQWGRQWQSSLGGLYLSVALGVDLSAGNGFHLTLATALGIANLLREYNIPVVLKWPNDLILLGRKLGGIKCETRTYQERIKQAVVGVGINWTNSPPEVGINLQSFWQGCRGAGEQRSREAEEQGCRGAEKDKQQTTNNQKPTINNQQQITSLEELAAITTYGIISGYQNYLEQGIDRLLTNYLELFHNLGQTVVVGDYVGTVVGVSSTGELQVRLRSPGASAILSLQPGQISLGYNTT
jgi:BirA family biotin operon repressor/biotin-[acetyl-CoA-carboxylase] ligase